MNVGAWFRERILLREASTRTAALLRIGVVLILWCRFGYDLILVRSLEPDRILLALAFFVTSTLFLVGWQTRLWGGLLGAVLVLMSYGYGQFWGADWFGHHVVLLVHGTILIAMMPSGGSYSVDRWLAVRRAEAQGEPIPPERGPYWVLPLLALQVSALYLWAAIDKSHWGFLSGQRLEMIFMDQIFGSDYPPFPGFRTFCAIQAVLTVALQYTLAFGLLVRSRFRPYLMIAGICMHMVIHYTLPVRVFSTTMVLFYLAYLDPDAVHRFIDRLQASPDAEPERARRAA